ncbi:sirohydrochlorin ferrochelatase [Bacillus pakistanensis]|uniref:Sirohydrochlorin ferrochelatase n=1 Tax=Rossellomorea pakistanensis TaxID=992288 RepID=A0ABS2N7C5_9BACI|nr:sirohydrochlorin chelatase [Bacillus pakistanensis]MBM7583760.1 sirohydrochlorin ferrochelatase [Bacillus pakistanensis]
MKQAVLYICHGSRLSEACNEAISFIKRCQKRIASDIHEICFLEIASPSIEDGFSSCIEQGATRITIAPLLLLNAVHAKNDIPKEIQKCMIKYPNVQVTYGKPIGVHEKMVESIMERIHETTSIDPTTITVLIGRGSSDNEVEKDLGQIANMVQKKSEVQEVWTCFLTVGTPSFQEMLLKVSTMHNNKMVFIPYLLFTGLLMKEIKNKINQTTHPNLHLGRYLSYDSMVEDAYIDRVIEAINNRDNLFTFKIEGDNYAPFYN